MCNLYIHSFILETLEVEEHVPWEAQRLFNGPLWNFSSVSQLWNLLYSTKGHLLHKEKLEQGTICMFMKVQGCNNLSVAKAVIPLVKLLNYSQGFKQQIISIASECHSKTTF